MTRSKFTVRMNANIPAAARKAADLAARAVFSEMFARMQDSLGQKAWKWETGTETQRSGGAPVGSPRNVIDTGLLRASGVAFFPTARSARFVWTANYASFVHDGAWIFPWGDKTRRVYLPARPWTAAVAGTVRVPGVEPYPLQERASELWKKFFRP